ncbi:hypothetical protein ACRQHG_05390 [Actinotignum sp. GS-2025a]|uniref:hypothetical protein n=1 Tax=Actinotignum sp. GS-2025a TaxID=3427274 RepID=UPI003F45C72E
MVTSPGRRREHAGTEIGLCATHILAQAGWCGTVVGFCTHSAYTAGAARVANGPRYSFNIVVDE